MDAFSKLTRLTGAAVLAFALHAGPAFAAEDTAPEADTATGEDAPAEAEEEGGKIQMAETPRDRVGLILLGALGLMTAGAGVTVVRQIGGKRPQADGEFRWR